MVFDDKTKESANRLWEEFKGKPWFSSVGLGEEEGQPVLIVYLRRSAGNEQKRVPGSWDNIPVRVQTIGRVIPANPNMDQGFALPEQVGEFRSHKINESTVEIASLEWLRALGYSVQYGPEIAPSEPSAERSDPHYRDAVLERRFRQALVRLNPDLPADALEDAYRKLTRTDAPSLVERNRAVHRMLVEGVTVESRRPDGSIAGAQAQVLDFDQPDNNDWLVVNQFTVAEGQHVRRADVVLFVNGLPLAVLELKNPADESTTIWSAYQQLQTYQAQIPSLFATNAALIVSDGVQARIGTLGAGKEWFKPWRTISGREDASAKLAELQVVLEGVVDKRRFLNLIRHFIVFEDAGGGRLTKKMAGYHQFHAVNVAVEETLRAARRTAEHQAADVLGRYEAGHQPGGEPGDRRVGVVWHTQGSGKSLTMAFYAGRVILHPAMANPTIVVLTDRNDLDDQLLALSPAATICCASRRYRQQTALTCVKS